MTGLRAAAWPADPQDLPTGEAYVLRVAASGLIRVRVPLVESPCARARTRAASGRFPATSLSLLQQFPCRQ